MYKCNKCGNVVDKLDTYEEYYPYGDSYCSREYSDYDCSCGGEYELAEERCKICGEYIGVNEEYDADEICDKCAKELKDSFNEVIGKAIRDNFTKEEWDIINDIIYEGVCVLDDFRY